MHRLVLYLVMPPILILFVAGLTLLGGMRLAYLGDYPDPFAPYEAMMPGRWVAVFEMPPCDAEVIPGNAVTIVCDLHPTDEHFALVSSSVYNGSFVETMFNANDLHIGDIVRHWGRPDLVVRYNHQFFALWEDQGLVGFIDPVGPARQFNYLLPVEQFSIGLESRNLP